MGNRVPGLLGDEAPLPGVTGGGISPPDDGIGMPGSVGLDTGNVGQAALVQTGWPRTLTWNDFPEIESRPEGVDEAAQIHSEVEQPARVSVQRQDGQYRVTALTVDISVDRSDSWVVRAHKSRRSC